uniref:DUF6817 domain-containing protein n=1 Tax=Quercus lobata TaxID=97700 RepID=A0A7N2KK42_QUELO
MPSSLSSPETQTTPYLQTLLDSARPFLRGELEAIDKNLPSLIAVLRSVGAGECFHKHGSFLQHLVEVYRILKIWKAPDSVCLCGLFHSAYSNSYVNLAIFDPSTGRDVVRSHVELVEHLKQSEVSLRNAKEMGIFNEEEDWRKKLRALLPANGLTTKNIKTGEDVVVSRNVIAVFLLMSMADFSDQYFSYQDALLDNYDGRLMFSGNNHAILWPGDGKPGLWMNSISKMGAIYSLIMREKEILKEAQERACGVVVETDRDEEDIELVVPPVFENCIRVLDAGEQLIARNLYWEAVCDMSKRGLERAEELLLSSIEKNPFVGEPHVVLGQVYLNKGRFEEAERGLTLMLEWGSAWDKRMTWEGWVSWARVLLMKAKEKSWPQTSWGILNLGLTK